MKVLVCDDQQSRCESVLRAIDEANQSDVETNQLAGKALEGALEQLFDNVDATLGEGLDVVRPSGTPFDDYDIAVVDNNLAHLRGPGRRITAESIVGYIRAFSTVPYVVSLNKNPDVDFDLRYLVGDYSTRADLAINEGHLANPALWTGELDKSIDGFRPWYWPALAQVAARRRSQIKFIQAHVDSRAVSSLKIPSEGQDALSPHAKGALCPSAVSEVPFEEITFRGVFLSRSRSLPDKKEREKLSEKGALGCDEANQIISRIVAADIDLWFRRDLLGPQEALVDIPHLLTRFPLLLGNRAAELNEWNKCVSAINAPFGLEEAVFTAHIAQAQYELSMWIPAPCFWYPKLKDNEKLNALFFESRPDDWLNAVFCEDTSAFADPSKDAVTEFSAEFEGSWGRRHVAKLKNVKYAPRSRFAI